VRRSVVLSFYRVEAALNGQVFFLTGRRTELRRCPKPKFAAVPDTTHCHTPSVPVSQGRPVLPSPLFPPGTETSEKAAVPVDGHCVRPARGADNGGPSGGPRRTQAGRILSVSRATPLENPGTMART
jgi:hypothetical protein